MKADKFIIVFDNTINDDDFGLSQAREYLNNMEQFKNSIIQSFTEEKIIELHEVFEIINDINGSMIGIYEDEIIYSQEIMKECVSNIKKYNDSLVDYQNQNLIIRIIEIFELAIKSNKNIYFLF